ncbi:WhiB family transcriptional regulator (plasmid) [Mycobacterium sp. TJFP1]
MSDQPVSLRFSRGSLYKAAPLTTSEAWAWQLAARCRGEDSSVFFTPDGERGSARKRRHDRAKAICSQCPVIGACRAHAMKYREPYGVWGGMSEDDRANCVRPRLRDSD